MALQRPGWLEQSRPAAGGIEATASPESILGGAAKGGGMGFLETVGAGILMNLVNAGLGAAMSPDQPKQKKKRQHAEGKSQAAQNLMAGGAPMRSAGGLQGMRPGAVQQGAANIYRQGSPFTG